MELRTCARTAAAVALIGLASACGVAGNVAVPRTTTPSATTTTTTTTTTATTTVSLATIPADVVGKSAKDVQTELNSLGFWDVEVYGPDGSPVVLTDDWHVVSVDGVGTNAPTTSRVTVRVEPNRTTTVAPPPPPQTTYQAPPPAYTPPAPTEVYYKNCAAARAAGAAPIYRGQPGYRAALDRDNDGIACE
ncbi:excalibur calcium-binding domain-containing protein [Kutzneria sp. CA-103260]|uniref:excalibur calcium-binding domain-containing protein n=1 Tax=Kutzneria sp. CA-103260 TaxID=2802641 RepID=UPI001BF109A8|nr:Excalibur calcium-binding domain protein [Kutzneria sp. CA-103260]